jgi:hypothetical protein
VATSKRGRASRSRKLDAGGYLAACIGFLSRQGTSPFSRLRRKADRGLVKDDVLGGEGEDPHRCSRTVAHQLIDLAHATHKLSQATTQYLQVEAGYGVARVKLPHLAHISRHTDASKAETTVGPAARGSNVDATDRRHAGSPVPARPAGQDGIRANTRVSCLSGNPIR